VNENARISVVVPALDEERALPDLLDGLLACEGPLEVLVVDGGSGDRTIEIARSYPGVRVLDGPRGRASQMNHGARAARGKILWFLHADSRVPHGATRLIRDSLADPSVALGAFRFSVDSPRPVFRLIEAGVRLRIAVFRLPYGDQGFFLRRRTFDEAGGFEEIPIMEDVHLVRSLRRRGRVVVLSQPLATSPRRWGAGGILAVTLRNVALAVADRLGVSPRSLARSRPVEKNGKEP